MEEKIVIGKVEVLTDPSNGKQKVTVTDPEGNEITSLIGHKTRSRAIEKGYLKQSNGRWKILDSGEYKRELEIYNSVNRKNNYSKKVSKKQMEIVNFLKTASEVKPGLLKIKTLKWKFLLRTALRGKNILVTGPAGSGKTLAAKSLAEAFSDREFFYFNMGASQDPRATLIGNTQFNPKKGTYFSESLFIKAIKTPNSIIMLDELSRMHPEASNILMTVLDEGQRYIRLDESEYQSTVKVAEGVTFIATANIGNEYTTTRVLDRALIDRFTILEMDTLDESEEKNLLAELFPGINPKEIEKVTGITGIVRKELRSEVPKISTFVSTRTAVEMISLIYDGFSMEESAEVTLYPLFSEDGGIDSERTFIKQVVQKYVDNGEFTEEELFNTEDIEG